jgi:EAL domain-containing protein (putative c-di-GMP-specific phosphodiesterase class I)
MEADTRERTKLSHDLRRSVMAQQLALFYQPQIELATGRVRGAESLLRWRGSDGTFVSPEKFIPVAESSGLIRPIGEWVLRTACMQLQSWAQRGLTDFRVAVNVSIDQFRMESFTELVRAAIAEYGVEPALLELEITESMAMDEIEIVASTLSRLKALGVSIAIDDFGTGFSSLGYLTRLSVDRLKIDRSFVAGMGAESARPRRAAARDLSGIPEMVIRLGHSLGLGVIAEGVEQEHQARGLQALGCDEAQGYFYCEPMDVEAFEQWLQARALLAR